MEDVRIEHRYNASHFKLDNHYENVYQIMCIFATDSCIFVY